MDRDQEEEEDEGDSSEHDSEDELALEDGSDEGDESDEVKVRCFQIEGSSCRNTIGASSICNFRAR